MRRFFVCLGLAALVVALLAAPGLAGSRPWVPDLNSPPSPAGIQAHWGTPAVDTVPAEPWLAGYPADTVPDHPLPEDMAGGS